MWKTKKFIKTYFLIIALLLIILILAGSYFSSQNIEEKTKEGLTPAKTPTPTPAKTPTPTPAKTPSTTPAKTPSTTLKTDGYVAPADALQNLQNILQNVGPFPDTSEFDNYRFNNPCKILANLKPIGNAPPPSKTLAPSKAVGSFQDVINKLVEACITAETKNESSHYMKVSQHTIGYTMYLKKIVDNIKAVDTKNLDNVTKLAFILRNNLLTYTEGNSNYYVPIDVMITYINSHLNFLIDSGVYNPTDTPEFVCNFNNLSVAQYGYIQNFTTSILKYMAAVVDINVPLDNSTKAKISTDIPRSIILLQTLNNNDTKNMKL